MGRKQHRNTADPATPDSAPVRPEPVTDASDDALLAQLPLTSVLEAMPDAVSVYHQSGRLLYMNAAARKLFQGSDEPVNMRRSWRKRFEDLQPSDADGKQQPIEQWHVARLLKGETITGEQPLEVYLTALNGAQRHVSITGGPITTADGTILGAIAVARDLTERRPQKRKAETQAMRAARELERLQVALDSAVMRLSLEDLLKELLERASAAIHTDTATLLMLDQRGEALTVRASRGLPPETAARVRVPLGKGFAGTIAATRKPLILRDTKHAEVVSAYLHDMLHTVVGVPLLVEDRLIGVLHVGSRTPRVFTASDVWLLQQIGERVALAIDRAQLYEAAQRAHKQAAEQARMLDAIIEALAEGVILYGPDRTTLLANSAYRQMMGIAPDGAQLDLDFAERGRSVIPRDITGSPLPEEQWPAMRVLRGEVIDGQHSQEVWLRSYEGRDALYSATGGPVYDEQGNFIGSVLALRDVSEHFRLEREATERAAELEAMIETMVDGVFVHDANGALISVNRSGRQHFGFGDAVALATAGETGSFSTEDLSQRIITQDGDGKTTGSAKQWPVARILSGETLAREHMDELLVRLPDGRERLLSVSGAPMRSADGTLLGAVMLTRDMTELHALRRRTQESLEALLEMAESAVSVTGRAATGESARYVGKRLIELAQRVLGCQRIALMMIDPESGAQRPLAVSGLRPEHERQWWIEQKESERHGARLDDSLDQEIIQRLRSGETVTIDLRDPRYQGAPNKYDIQTVLISPLLLAQRLIGYIALDYAGEPHEFTTEELDLASAVSKLAALVIDRDRILSERSAAEAQMLALEQANQRMNEFLGIAAHELRTPITVIKANLQMLMRRVAVFNERAAGNERVSIEAQRLTRFSDLLNRTEKALTRLTRLVDDLLDVSRVHAGKLEMRIEPTDLAEITREAVEEQRIAAPDREITLDLPVNQPTQIVADPERVEQVITNYLTNALKYSAANKPVHVRLWRDGAMLYVGVTDEGPGIPSEYQEQVWELFQRVPGIEVVSGSGIGLGLGLHLCKTLIERQGGHVGVVSQQEKGSTFWLSLPLCDDTAVQPGSETP